MTKGDKTRERIIAKAAPLFNKQGYSGASLADIMAVTGLKKGGIYNHFASKDELALAAFEYNWTVLSQLYAQAIKAAGPSPVAQLLAAIDVQARFADNPPIQGGCPMLNTAIESDDGHPLLRERVQAAITSWRRLITTIITRGIAQGEFKPTVDGDEWASVMISVLEGGVMLSMLYADPTHLHRAVAHLRAYIQTNLLA
jgi:TetR/AcrR family transcriptional regulator, transcriptional repressor for nem operon